MVHNVIIRPSSMRISTMFDMLNQCNMIHEDMIEIFDISPIGSKCTDYVLYDGNLDYHYSIFDIRLAKGISYIRSSGNHIEVGMDEKKYVKYKLTKGMD